MTTPAQRAVRSGALRGRVPYARTYRSTFFPASARAVSVRDYGVKQVAKTVIGGGGGGSGVEMYLFENGTWVPVSLEE
jgi:hypothetical protein